MKKIINSNLIINNSVKSIEKSVIFLFGGLHYANTEWMFSQVPSTLLLKHTFVIISHNTSFKTAYNAFQKFLKRSLKNKEIILIGFSAGAKQVQKIYSPDFKLVGLIDPSTNINLSKRYSKNTILSYNYSNWNNIPSVQNELPILQQRIDTAKGITENIDLEHKKFVKYFFKKFICNL